GVCAGQPQLPYRNKSPKMPRTRRRGSSGLPPPRGRRRGRVRTTTMRMPKIFIPGAPSDDAIATYARDAEAAGIDGVFLGDHVTFYGNGSDALIKLAALAAVSTKLELQTCV